MKIKNDKYHWVESMERDEQVKIEVKGVKERENGGYYIIGEYEGNHFKQNIGDWDADLQPGWYIMECTRKLWKPEHQRYYHYVQFNPVNSLDTVINEVTKKDDPTVQTRLDEKQVREQYGDYEDKQAEDIFPTQSQIKEEDTYQSQLSQQMRSEWEKEKQKVEEEQEKLHQKQKQLNKEKEMIDYILQGGKV